MFFEIKCHSILILLILKTAIALNVLKNWEDPQKCLLKSKESFFHTDVLYVHQNLTQISDKIFQEFKNNLIYQTMPKNYLIENYIIFFENLSHLQVVIKILSGANTWFARGKFLLVTSDINIMEIFIFIFEFYLFKAYVITINDDKIYRASYNCADKSIEIKEINCNEISYKFDLNFQFCRFNFVTNDGVPYIQSLEQWPKNKGVLFEILDNIFYGAKFNNIHYLPPDPKYGPQFYAPAQLNQQMNLSILRNDMRSFENAGFISMFDYFVTFSLQFDYTNYLVQDAYVWVVPTAKELYGWRVIACIFPLFVWIVLGSFTFGLTVLWGVTVKKLTNLSAYNALGFGMLEVVNISTGELKNESSWIQTPLAGWPDICFIVHYKTLEVALN